jgi:hypothetical protein
VFQEKWLIRKSNAATADSPFEVANGKPLLAVHLYQDAMLGGAEIGFELLGGMRTDMPKS